MVKTLKEIGIDLLRSKFSVGKFHGQKSLETGGEMIVNGGRGRRFVGVVVNAEHDPLLHGQIKGFLRNQTSGVDVRHDVDEEMEEAFGDVGIEDDIGGEDGRRRTQQREQGDASFVIVRVRVINIDRKTIVVGQKVHLGDAEFRPHASLPQQRRVFLEVTSTEIEDFGSHVRAEDLLRSESASECAGERSDDAAKPGSGPQLQPSLVPTLSEIRMSEEEICQEEAPVPNLKADLRDEKD